MKKFDILPPSKIKIISALFISLLFLFPRHIYASDISSINEEELISITDGALYEAILSVCNYADVYTDLSGESITIDLSLFDSPNEFATPLQYIWSSARILGKADFSDYKSVYFFYFPDDDAGTLAQITINDFVNITDFTSSIMCISLDEDASDAKDLINALYIKTFYNHDQSIKSKEFMNELSKSIGQYDNVEEIEYQQNDYLWLFSSFTPEVKYRLDGDTFIVNYHENYLYKHEYGIMVNNEIQNAAQSFSKFYAINPSLLSFYKIAIVAYDGEGNDNGLYDITLEYKADGSWETLQAHAYDNDFYSGIMEED